MPNFKVIVRGGLALTSKLEDKKPTGSVVSLTEEQASLLPAGTVELIAEKKPEPKPEKKEGGK